MTLCILRRDLERIEQNPLVFGGRLWQNEKQLDERGVLRVSEDLCQSFSAIKWSNYLYAYPPLIKVFFFQINIRNLHDFKLNFNAYFNYSFFLTYEIS